MGFFFFFLSALRLMKRGSRPSTATTRVNCLQSGVAPSELQALCCLPVDACSGCSCQKKFNNNCKCAALQLKSCSLKEAGDRQAVVVNRLHPVAGLEGARMAGGVEGKGEGSSTPPTTGQP